MNHNNTQNTRVALVTGAARRIGAVTAVQLHQAGFRVAIHYHRSEQEALTLADKLNQQRLDSAFTIKADLAQKEKLPSLISQTLAWAGQIDLLVNNASVFLKTPDELWGELTWDRLFNINVKAPFWLSHLAYSHLAKVNGSIVNITDMHINKPLKAYSVYCQSKAALDMQTRTLACEFAPKVRVNAVAPGSIMWPEQENTLTESAKKAIITETPLQQHGNPEAIAIAVLSMADNNYITGQTLIVDGGRVLK